MPPLLDTLSIEVRDITEPLQSDYHLVNLPDALSTGLSATVVQAFRFLIMLNEKLVQSYSALGCSIWECPSKIDQLVNPVVRQFLSPSCRSEASALETLVSSCCRSAAILYLAEFRRRSGISPVLTGVHVQKLRESLDAVKELHVIDHVLHLWLLTVGAIQSTVPCDRSYFLEELARVKLGLVFISPTEFTELLGKTVWFDAIFEGQVEKLLKLL